MLQFYIAEMIEDCYLLSICGPGISSFLENLMSENPFFKDGYYMFVPAA